MEKLVDATSASSSAEALLTGLFGGLAAPAYLYQTTRYLEETPIVQSLRSDWERIGQDFRTVIEREHIKSAGESAE
jgi:hypothetical protein